MCIILCYNYITGQLLNSYVIQILYFKSKLVNRRIKRTHKLFHLQINMHEILNTYEYFDLVFVFLSASLSPAHLYFMVLFKFLLNFASRCSTLTPETIIVILFLLIFITN